MVPTLANHFYELGQMQQEPIAAEAAPVEEPGKGMCGIIMPMSASEGYSEEHWKQMLTLVEDAALEASFTSRIVSTNPSGGILQSNLVTNLYQDEIVVCDVSSRNANVMLELGMRIAFGRPFLVIKDRDTPFSSDINVVIHEQYDKGMLYPEAKAFKSRLANLIKHEGESAKQLGYKSFLSTFKIPHVKLQDVDREEIGLTQAVEGLLSVVATIQRQINALAVPPGLSQLEKDTVKKFVLSKPDPRMGVNYSIMSAMQALREMGVEREGRLYYDELYAFVETLGLGQLVSLA